MNWARFRFGFQVFLVASAAFLITMFGLAFMAEKYHEETMPDNLKTQVNLLAYPQGLSQEQALELVLAQAKKQRINVSALRRDADSDGWKRMIFTLVGNPETFPWRLDSSGAQAAPQEIGSFIPGVNMRVLPYTEAGRFSLLGHVGLSGDAKQRDIFAAELAGQGFKTEAIPVEFVRSPAFNLVFSPIEGPPIDPGAIVLFLAAGLLLAVSAVHVTVRRQKVAALRISGGCGRTKAQLYEYGVVTLAYAAIIAPVGAIGSLMTMLYNGGFGLERLWTMYLQVSLIGLLIVWVMQTVTLLLISIKPLEQVLRGWRPVRLVAIISTAGMFFGLIVAAESTSLIVKNLSPLTRLMQDQQIWEREKDVVYSGVRSYFRKDKTDQIKYGWVIRQMDKAGKVLIARPSSNYISKQQTGERNMRQGMKPDGSFFEFEAPESITVNNAYLQRHELYDSDGNRIWQLPEHPGVVYLAIPEDLKEHEREFVREWYRNEDNRGIFESALITHEYTAERSDPEVVKKYGLSADEIPRELDLRIIYTRPGQKLFTYASLEYNKPLLENPIVTIDSPKAGVMPDEDYSWPGTYLTDRQLLIETMEQVDFSGQPIQSAAQDNLDFIRKQIALVWNTLGISLLALVLLVVYGVVGALAYLDRNRRRIGLQAVQGWSFLSTYGRFLLLVFLLVVAARLLVHFVPFSLIWGRAYMQSTSLGLSMEDFGVTLGLYALTTSLLLATVTVIFLVGSRKLSIEVLKDS